MASINRKQSETRTETFIMLELNNISASYQSIKALDDVSLSIACGEIVGIVGPNGAGKTTLFKIIARILDRYEGTVSYNGNPLKALESREIGYLAEVPFQFDYFTPAEMLLFERSLRNPQLPAEQVFTMLDTWGLVAWQDTKIRELSQGLKKRVALSTAFLGDPSLLVLDEPLNAIDIQTVIVLKRLIREAAARGAIVLISSHVLDFFDGLIERVVFLNQGSIHCASSDDTRTTEELYVDLFMCQGDEELSGERQSGGRGESHPRLPQIRM
jgi:ABC-type multidrug transport system ATPase subunit